MTPQATTGPLSSGEILHVLHTLNRGEMEQAELALQRSSDPQVQRMAQMIRGDHTASNERIAALADKAGIGMEASSISEVLTTQGSQIKQTLAGLSGEEFDRGYLERQIELHRLALDTIRSQLVPSVQDPQVSQLLSSEAPKLEMHLREAQNAMQS